MAVVLGTNGTSAAFYDYDAAGNITAIRTQTVDAVNLFVFSPEAASANANVTLQGTGFSTNAVENTVLFGSVTAQVVSASANFLKSLVPTNAVSGLLSVTTPSGSATNSRTFTANIGVQVMPSSCTVSVLLTQQFSTTVFGTNSQGVTWNINGWIPTGSNSLYGSITTNGVYTAPTNAPLGGVVTIRARSVADSDPLKEGVASVTITSLVTQSGPIYSPTVSAQPGIPSVVGPIYSPTVSTQPGVPNVVGPIYSSTVSVGPP